MARTPTDSGLDKQADSQESLIFQAHGAEKIDLPSTKFISDAKMTRDGDDLVLETPDGQTAVVEGYFAADPAPLLQSPDGSTLTPNLVNAFAKSPLEFAANETMSDQSPVGAVEEVKGEATVTRADGTVETITIGTPIYQGDIITTDAKGAVNITFIDETTMAVSENARLAIDEYSFDPATESGTTNFSVLRGLFVFTSGLIGRDDPDDVTIDTPVGSIGIRGTIIAGEINPGGVSNVTVLEGAIVVKNSLAQVTLSEQFETVRLGGFDQPMQELGVVPANEINHRFESIGNVSPSLFTIINDAVKEQSSTQPQSHTVTPEPAEQTAHKSEPAQETNTQTPPPVSADIVNLTGPASGLPSQQTALGSISPAAGDSGSTNIFGTTTGLPSSNAAPPPASPVAADTISTTPPVVTQPSTPTIPSTPALPPFVITVAGASVSDVAKAGALLGTVTTSAAIAGVSYNFANGTTLSDDGHYNLVNTASGAELRLTTSGEAYFAGSLDSQPLANFNILAHSADGRTASASGAISVTDASGSNVVNLDNPGAYQVSVISDNLPNKVGYSITALGDINGDGFDDFAFTNNVDNQNHIYIVHGGVSNLPSGNITALSGGRISTITNPTPGEDTSQTVIAGVGDYNGDGQIDYVIGQAQNSSTGGASSTGGNAAIISTDGSGSSQFSTTTAPGTGIGGSVDGIGDFNNDGYADVIIGASGYNGNGAVFLSLGHNSWGNLSSTPSITGSSGSGFGTSAAGIGDYNGDGYSDFAVSAPLDGSNAGSVSIYYGSPSGPVTPNIKINGAAAGDRWGTTLLGLGDVNGDGLSDILIGGENGKAAIYSTSASSSTSLDFGNYALIGAGSVGDFNGDGYDDFSISLADGNGSHSYIVFGKGTMPTNIDLSYLKDGQNALEIKYSGADDSKALTLQGIGDINGDGYDDLAIGVPDANGAATGDGGVMVLYGRQTGGGSANAVVGNAGSDFLNDNNMSGMSLRGGAGDDVLEIHNTNFLGIDGGSNSPGGEDVLKMFGDLNFTNVNYEKISGIEKLEYGGTGQTITLTLENLFNLMKTSDTGILKIEAGSGNTLIIDAPSTTGSTPTEIQSALNEMGSGASYDGIPAFSDYHKFSIGGYELYINTDLAVSVQ